MNIGLEWVCPIRLFLPASIHHGLAPNPRAVALLVSPYIHRVMAKFVISVAMTEINCPTNTMLTPVMPEGRFLTGGVVCIDLVLSGMFDLLSTGKMNSFPPTPGLVIQLFEVGRDLAGWIRHCG